MIGHKNNGTKGTNNAPIPEDNEQYCFRMPLKLEVHKRYCSTQFSSLPNGFLSFYKFCSTKSNINWFNLLHVKSDVCMVERVLACFNLINNVVCTSNNT